MTSTLMQISQIPPVKLDKIIFPKLIYLENLTYFLWIVYLCCASMVLFNLLSIVCGCVRLLLFCILFPSSIIHAILRFNLEYLIQQKIPPYFLTFSSRSLLTRSRSSTVSCVDFRSCSTFLLAFSTSARTFFSRSRLSSS